MNPRTAGSWALTGLLALALTGSGIGALVRAESVVAIMLHLGYPTFVGPILGFWYIAAAVALVAPGLLRVKEWAYAGVMFAMTGALASHLFAGDGFAESAPSAVLATLTLASYLLRPNDRRLVAQ